jgi:putative endopeptidase
VNGPLANLPAFAEAFQCKAGDRMVRAERCEIW